MRALKILVVVMGVMLVVGLCAGEPPTKPEIFTGKVVRPAAPKGKPAGKTADRTVELKADEDCLKVTLNDEVTDGSFLAEVLVRSNFKVKMLKEEEIDLEDVFMGITKGITN